mgnify:CR=1 FL=1|tara:strand:+ start:340 stop:639 length:300 start_codon:yes stop_codon:yes gene_type:complete
MENRFLLNTYTLEINCGHNKSKYLHQKTILRIITDLKRQIKKESDKCNNAKYVLDENYKIYDKVEDKIFITFNIMYELIDKLNESMKKKQSKNFNLNNE